MLISAIMPTRGRPGFALQALGSFLAQSWPEKELVIVDDADNRSFEQPPEYPGVHYHLTERRMKLGDKRNFAIEHSSGEVIAHFDDDDFSEQGRLEDQAIRLHSSAKAVTGYHSMRFWDEESRQWWQYRGEDRFAHGTSLCYQRSFWEKNRFQPLMNIGEDSIFLGSAMKRNALVSVDGTGFMWARRHPGNTIGKTLTGSTWRRVA